MAEKKDPKKSIHTGHRERMRKRFAKDARLDGFAEHEIMEMLLFFVLTRKDTNAIAHDLIDQFGSVGGVLSAPVDRLKQVKDIGDNGAVMLKLFGAISDHVSRQQFINIDASDREAFTEYVKRLFIHENVESFMAICITADMHVGMVSRISTGTASSTPVNLRELVRTVLNGGGENIILAHNHPDSTCRPSSEDIMMTRKIMQYLAPFDIHVLDHYIVGNDGAMSMRGCGFIHDMEC
jgi:DNA repair protein RadC